jgi:type II secretory pathway pseudopilin PulG
MTKRAADNTQTHGARVAGQRGYTLVALLAMMTLFMIAAMAAAPSIRQQSQRDRELEAIARGEEVAEAIRLYIRYKRQPPTSMRELLDGVNVSASRKLYVLRASAACDPLTSHDGKCGEWRTVKANDPALINFVKQLAVYANGRTPNVTADPALAPFAAQIPRVTGLLDLGESEEAPGGEDDSVSTDGPFLGVVSRSRRASVVSYYGIERHDQWVFTPFFR